MVFLMFFKYIFISTIYIKLFDWPHLLLNKNDQEPALLVTVGLFVSKIIWISGKFPEIWKCQKHKQNKFS